MDRQSCGNYSSCCRLCLMDNMNTLKPIFDDVDGSGCLVAKILSAVGVQVHANDKISTMICDGCLQKINNWESYKEKCNNNQEKLQTWLRDWNQTNNQEKTVQIKPEPVERPQNNDVPEEIEINEDDDCEVVIKQEPCEQVEEDFANFVSAQMEVDETTIYRSPEDAKKCMYCGKMFSTPGNRRKHEKIMHENRSHNNRYADISIADSQGSGQIEIAHSIASNDSESVITAHSSANDQQDQVSNDTDYEKIEFAGALQLQAANGPSKTPVNSPMTKVENCYVDKCKKMIMMFNTLLCICHGLQHKTIKRLFAHLRSLCHWFPVYTCYNCMITFVDRSSVMKHNSKCQRRQFENLIRLSAMRCNSEKKIRLYLSFKCMQCTYTFNFYEDYCAHIDSEHLFDEPPYNCSCGTVFEDVYAYQSHLHKSCLLQYYCDVCFEIFTTMDEFKQHAEDVHDQSDGFVFLPVGGNITTDKIDKSFETSLNSLNMSLSLVPESSNTTTTTDEGDHEFVECAPDLEIGTYDDYNDLTPPPPPKNWNSKTSCTICGRTYSNYHNMMRHFKTHSENEKTIPCEYCDEMFRLKSQVKEHLVIEHGILDSKARISMNQSNFPCPECNIIFTTLDEWNKHKRTHPQKTCEECGMQFAFQSELEQHRSVHLTLKVYRDSKTQAYKSAQVSPSSVDLLCKMCNISFKSVQDLQDHTLQHVKQEPVDEDVVDVKPKKYSCETCNKHYVGYGGLWEHNKRYHPDRRTSKDYPRQCKYCDKVLMTGGAYFMHKQMHERSLVPPQKPNEEPRPEGEDEDYFTCKRCFKVFTSKYNLKNHMKCHGINLNASRNPTGKGGKFKTYWCNICHQACQGYMELQSHKQEHEVEKMNEMREINQFKTTNHKMKPKANSTDDESMELELSEGEFQPEYSEELEVLDIKDNIIYPCDICDMEFDNKNALRKHKERHDEELPPTQKHTYVYCKYCKIPFVSVDKLNEHMELEHDEIPGRAKPKPVPKAQKFPCNLCKKVFDTSGALCSHQGWHKRIRAGEKSKVLLKQVLREFPKPKYECKTCNHTFINDTALQIHILEVHRNINTSVVMPRCEMCDMDFENQAALDKHNQFHKIVEQQKEQQQQQQQRQFNCKYCNKVFAGVEALHTHVKQFHREKSQTQHGHVCPVCNRVFERPQALATHVKIHERERFVPGPPKQQQKPAIKEFLYSCSICHLGFNVPKDLRNHIIASHPF